MRGWIDDEAVSLIPQWLLPVVDVASTVTVDQMTRFPAPAEGGRRASVLILFGHSDGPDVLILERAARMRAHAGQPAFPGGAIDDTDDGPVAAALREASEETGLDPSGVVVFGALPDLYVPVSDFVVTPILGWWAEPSEVGVVDSNEVASVHRVPVAELVDPANRVRVVHPSGYVGPGFEVRDLLVWGFTAGILDRLIAHAGWAVPWDETRVVTLESR